MNYDIAEQEIVTRLNEFTAARTWAFTALRLPQTDAEYARITANGRSIVYVGYAKSTTDGHQSTSENVTNEQVHFEVVIVSRQLRGNGGVLDTLRKVKLCLAGFRPKDLGRLWYHGGGYHDRIEDQIRHSHEFCGTTVGVMEVIDADDPILEQLDFDSTFGGTTVPDAPTPTAGIYVNAPEPTFSLVVPAGTQVQAPPITVTEVDGTPRSTPPNENITCAWSTLEVYDTAGNLIEEVTEYPEDGRIEVPAGGVCEPATYTNGAAFTQEIAAGATFTAPEISVTQVDGSVDDIVPNIDVVCEWSPLKVVTSDSDLEFLVNTYPTNGEIVLPARRINDGATTFILSHRNRTFITNARLSAAVNDAPNINSHNLTIEVNVPVVNSAGQSLGLNVDDLLTSHVMPDVTLDDDNVSQQFPMPAIILLDGVVASAAYSVGSGNGVLTITPATPAPPALIPAVVLVTQLTSYRQRDEGWAVTNNRFNYLSTGITQSIDRAAASPWTTLANTHLGSTARFRDTSNNALAYGDSPTANNIVRDYLTDFEYYTERFTDGEGFDDICDKVAALTLGGHSDWVLVPRALMASLWDMNNTNAPNTLNGRPPGFNNNWHNSIMTGTTYDLNTAQVYVTFSNGTVRRTAIQGKTAGALNNYIVCRRMNSY